MSGLLVGVITEGDRERVQATGDGFGQLCGQ